MKYHEHRLEPGAMFRHVAASCVQSWQGNALDLDVDSLGQLLDRHAASGGLVGEPLGVLLVHILWRVSPVVSSG